MGPTILTPRQRRRAVGAASVGGVLPVLVVVVGIGSEASGRFLIGAALAALAPIGATLSSPHNRWIRWPCAFGGLPGLTLMQADTGGVASPYAILLVMGMVWFGLMASDRELVVGVLLTLGCCFLPMLVVGPPAYPVQIANAVALALVNCSVLLGLATSTRETVRLTRRLRHEANHDRLTDLLNRRGWDDAIDSRLGSLHLGAAEPDAVIALVDLDQLKEINDRFGHDRGDQVLRAVAHRLRDSFDSDVTVCRLGGDEFAMLCTGRPATYVVEVLDGVRDRAAAGESFSAGVAVQGPSESASDAIRRADLALYEAKSAGRHRTCLAQGPVPDTIARLPADRH